MVKPLPVLTPSLPKAEELLPYLKKIDESRHYTNFGPLSSSLRERLCAEMLQNNKQALNADHVCLTNSGTSALTLALSELQLPPKSNVLLPSYTFPATAMAVVNSGLHPIFCDVDKASWSLECGIVKQFLAESTLKIAAVIPVACHSAPVNSLEWDEFYRDTGIPVIIDAAAALPNQTIGHFGIYCFSMHATKAFGCGEGGLIVTRKTQFIEECRHRSNFGFGEHSVLQAGMNAKISEYHAAVGLAALDGWNKKADLFKTLHRYYLDAISASCADVKFQTVANTKHLVASTFSVTLPIDAEKIALQLEKEGITTRQWYTPALHTLTKVFVDSANGSHRYKTRPIPKSEGAFPVTQYLVSKNIGLPFHTEITERDVDKVCAALKSALSKNS